LIIQILLGIITLLSGAQMFVSSMHQISSIFLISSSIYLLYLNTKTS
jgi:cytochrome c oxidase assembly protein subunit 15